MTGARKAGRSILCAKAMLGIVAQLGSAACDDPDFTLPPPATTCPAEPTAAVDGAAIIGCDEHSDCPPGTSCDVGGGACPSNMRGCCKTAYFATSTPDALVKGFRVAEFDLRAEALPLTRFSVNPPPEAQRVVCGLFVADPQLSPGARGRIQNETQALFRTHVFRRPAVSTDREQIISFDVSDLRTVREWPPCKTLSPFNSRDPSYPVVTTLQIGCWAYDGTEIVAATRLRTLNLTDIPEVQPPIVDCTTVAGNQSDGRFCLPLPQTGVCRLKQCIALAPADASDPPDAGNGPDAGGPATANPVRECTDSTEGLLCQRSSDFRFGRCVGNRCADQNIQSLEQPLVVSNCAIQGEETDWLNCFDSRVQGYGTCLNHRCRLRCISDDECTKFVSVLTAEDQVKMSCVKLARERSAAVCSDERTLTSYLGVCVPVEQPPCACQQDAGRALCN